MEERYLKMKDLEKIIEELSYSQGYYGRLKRDITELKKFDKQSYKELTAIWEGKKFTKALDFILYLEC